MHPSTMDLLAHFDYEHLGNETLKAVSRPFHDHAHRLVDAANEDPRIQGAELTAGLRKLLEAKDCIVRAYLPVVR